MNMLNLALHTSSLLQHGLSVYLLDIFGSKRTNWLEKKHFSFKATQILFHPSDSHSETLINHQQQRRNKVFSPALCSEENIITLHCGQ